MHIDKTVKFSFIFILLAILVVLGLDVFFYHQKTYTYHKPEQTPPDLQTFANPPPSVIKANQLSIPSLGIVAPIIYTNKTGEEAFQEALMNGVVHYPGTALPGHEGNVYIFGHSSDLPWSKGNYKTVFEQLPNIKANSIITITDTNGNVFHYQVTKQFVVEAKDVSVLTQPKNKWMLSLQTSYPIGTALKRYIVQAELVEMR